jgi:hypothetical protein
MSRRRRAALWIGVGLALAVAVGLWRASGNRAGAPPAPAAAPVASRAAQPAAASPSRPQAAPLAPAAPAPAPIARAPVIERAPGKGAIEGVVLSATTGAGIEGAELTFQRDDGAFSVRSGPGGAFSFEVAKGGRHRLAAAAADGYLPFAPAWGHSPLTVDVADGVRVRGIAIRLTPAVRYAVRVQDREGHAVAGAEVRVLGAATGELALLPLPDRYTSDANGLARVLAPDGAVIEGRHAAHGSGRAVIGFEAQVSRQVVLRLGGGGRRARAADLRIAGRAVDPQGAPVASAVVVANYRGRGAHPLGEALTGPDGAFAVGGLDAGEYELEVRADRFAPARVRCEAGDSEVRVELRPGGAISGTVRDAQTGGPVASFTVQVWRRKGPLREDLEASRAFVSPDGAYTVSGLSAGPASLVVAAPGYAPSADVPIAIAEDGSASAGETSLRPGARLAGRVVESKTSAAVAGARVSVEGRRGEGGGPSLATSAVSDEQGAFELTGLSAGPISLFVAAEGHHARIVGVPPLPAQGAPPPLTIALTPLADGEDPSIELAGIGAVLSADGEVLLVQRVLPGGGAAEAGLTPGDRLIAIEGHPVVELGFEGAMATIRGPEGTSVLLRVRRGEGAPADLVVYRRLVRG